MSRSRPFHFHSRRLLGMRGVIAAVCVLGLGASPAPAKVFESIEVVVEPQPAVEGSPLEPRHGGYIEFRVVVQNHSKTADHKVRLVQPASTMALFCDYLARNSRTVQVAHGETLVVSLVQPLVAVADQSLAVEINGVRQKDAVELPSPFAGFSFSSAPPPPLVVLASRGIPQDLKDKVRNAHPNEITFCRSELAAGEWSPNWLGYTGYDLLLMTEQEAASLPAEVLLALRRYVEAGGIVLVQRGVPYSKKLIPNALRDPDVAADDDDVFHVGFGQVRTLPRDDSLASGILDREIQRHGGPDGPQCADRHRHQRAGSWAVDRGDFLRYRHRACQRVAVVAAPEADVALVERAGGVAGDLPDGIRLFAFFRGDKRPRTHGLDHLAGREHTPRHDAGICFVLLPVDAVRRIALLVRHRGGATPLGAAAGPGLRRGRGKTMDWTNDQHLDSGWVVAGVPACFAIRKSETRAKGWRFARPPMARLPWSTAWGSRSIRCITSMTRVSWASHPKCRPARSGFLKCASPARQTARRIINLCEAFSISRGMCRYRNSRPFPKSM